MKGFCSIKCLFLQYLVASACVRQLKIKGQITSLDIPPHVAARMCRSVSYVRRLRGSVFEGFTSTVKIRLIRKWWMLRMLAAVVRRSECRHARAWQEGVGPECRFARVFPAVPVNKVTAVYPV